MSDHKWDPDGVDRAAKNLLGTPLVYLTDAHNRAKTDCQLNALAFGIACHFILSGPYEQSRAYAEKNLQGALDMLHSIHDRLHTTATTYRDVEAANKIHLV